MRYGTTLGEGLDRAQYDRGDVIDIAGERQAVIQEVLLSATHLDIKYRLEWKDSETKDVVPERGLSHSRKIREMSRPYCW